MEPLIIAFLLLLILPLYFAPIVVAFSRRHPHKYPILIVNLFLGWTFVIWVGCLAWSFMPIKRL